METSNVLRSALTGMLLSISLSAHAYADPKVVSVPPGDLTAALESLARQSGVELIYEPDQLKGLRTEGVRGTLELQDAVRALLRGTSLSVSADSSGAMLIAPPVQSRGGLPRLPGSTDGAKTVQPKTTTWNSSAAPIRLAQVGAPVASGTFTGQNPAAATTGLEEVTVTARRRDESLLSVPVSVSAFTSEDIAARDIIDLNGIAAYTPNMTISNAGVERNDRSSQTVIIRGMVPVNSGTTSVFIDGAPISDGFITGIDDVERVEVIRGPQSAEFGRQTFAGAVNVVTKNPGNDYKARVEAEEGSNNLADYRLEVEGPIVSDILSVRLAARYYSVLGQYQNSAPPYDPLNSQSTWSFNGSLYFTPRPDLRVRLFGQIWQDNDGPTAIGKFTSQNYNCAPGQPAGAPLTYICGTLPRSPTNPLASNTIITPLIQSTVIDNSLGVLAPLFANNLGLEHGGLLRQANHTHLIVDYDVPGLAATLSSLTSVTVDNFAEINSVQGLDTTNTVNPDYGVIPDVQPTLNWLFDYNNHTEDWSEELRLASLGAGRLKWHVGANYYHSLQELEVGALIPTGVVSFQSGAPGIAENYAVFFSVSYDVTAALNVSFDAREQRDIISSQNRSVPGGVLSPGVKEAFDNFIPRVIAEYHFFPQMQAYASFSQGINPGAFNADFTSLTAAQQAYLHNTYGAGIAVKPEELTNYEIGVKGRFWEDRAQITADVYHAIWDKQILYQSLVTPLPNGAGETLVSAATNAGRTDLDGLEVEGVVIPVTGLTLDLAGGIAGSDVREYACLTCTALTGITDFRGKQLPNYSKYSASIGSEYRHALGDSWQGYGRIDYRFKSGLYDTVADTVRTTASNNIDLRVGGTEGPLLIEGFVTNLTNDRAFTSIESNVNILNFSQQVVNVGMPILRRYGVRLQYRF